MSGLADHWMRKALQSRLEFAVVHLRIVLKIHPEYDIASALSGVYCREPFLEGFLFVDVHDFDCVTVHNDGRLTKVAGEPTCDTCLYVWQCYVEYLFDKTGKVPNHVPR